MKKFMVVSSCLALFLLFSACSRQGRVPAEFSAVPADVDIVGTVDAKAFIDYLKEALPRLAPPEMKDKIPSFQTLAEQALKIVGIDISQLKRVVFVGYSGAEDKMAILAEGVKLGNPEGSSTEDYQGVKVHSLPQSSSYLARLGENWVVMAPTSEMVKKILDTSAGRQKRLADGQRAALFKELAAQNTDLDQVRFYLLSGSLPGTPSGANIRGGSFLLHLDKGVTGNLLGDEKSAQDLKAKLDLGLMSARMIFSLPQNQNDSQLSMDEESKKAVLGFLNKLESKVQGGTLSISYRGSLKPLIEKAVALGVKSWKKSASSQEETNADSEEEEDQESEKNN